MIVLTHRRYYINKAVKIKDQHQSSSKAADITSTTLLFSLLAVKFTYKFY